jgi:glycosyltransferase involved in cell wall biosynthesis
MRYCAPMRTLHVTNAVKWSGGLKQISILLRELDRRGHDNILVCSPESELPDRLDADLRRRVLVERVAMHQDYDLFAAARLRILISAHRVDIVHAHHSRAHAIALLSLALAPGSAKRPGLIISRRVSFAPSGNLFSRWKYCSNRIGGYAAVSCGVRDTLSSGGVEPSKIRVIYSAVDPAEFSEDATTSRRVRAEIGIPEGVSVVGKIGNYGIAKGQHVLLEAARECLRTDPRIVFLLAGRGLEMIASDVASLGLEQAVRVLGFRTDVPALLSIMDMSVNAAIGGEGLSGAMRESLLMGVPVVASDVSGNKEIVRDRETGRLVPPGDPRALAAAILEGLAQPLEGRRMAQRGREWVLKNAVPETLVEGTLGLYRSVIEE